MDNLKRFKYDEVRELQTPKKPKEKFLSCSNDIKIKFAGQCPNCHATVHDQQRQCPNCHQLLKW